ncbi:hypothetical protein [Leptospira bouyouniensis]|uniref:hypothetical protein n=1 Tax=Leptospira bouyouniensis TaxID=2484911 RepID=UPI001ABFF0D2|nr:hypothetical protein [Leptospira bouyouniensis]
MDILYSIPLAKLKSGLAESKKEILQPPFIDKNGQLIFVFMPDKNKVEKGKTKQDEEMTEKILGMFSYKIYFPSEWKPKSGNIRLVNSNQSMSIEIISTGNGVLIDFPMRYVIAGSILTLSKTENVDSKVANDYIEKMIKEKEVARKKEEEERKKQNEIERKKQEEYEREEAKRKEEEKKQQELDDKNDGEEE